MLLGTEKTTVYNVNYNKLNLIDCIHKKLTTQEHDFYIVSSNTKIARGAAASLL